MRVNDVFRWIWPAAALALAVTIAPRASGECISTCHVPQFDPGPIPVYVSADSASGTSLAYVGLGGDVTFLREEVNAVKAAIDIINSGSAATPRLYYAGVDSSVLPLGFGSVEPGITISTFSCDWEESEGFAWQEAGTGSNVNKARVRIKRGVAGNCRETFITNWWVDPADDDGNPDQDHDLVGVIVHELLHSLGLNHTEGAAGGAGTCCQTFPYSQSLVSVMSANFGDHKDFRRRLRRDDLDGLLHLYGDHERTIYYAESGTVPPTAASWSTPTAINPATLTTNTPVSLSNGAHDNDPNIMAGFTDTVFQVRFFTGTFAGWNADASSGTLVPGYPNSLAFPLTYDRVAVARGVSTTDGNERLLVAWVGQDASAMEQPELATEVDVRINWRVRNDGVWQLPDQAGPTRFKNFSVAYDPRLDRFVLALIDTYPSGSTSVSDTTLFVTTINGSTGQEWCVQALVSVDPVFAVGDVACDYLSSVVPTRCVIPVGTTGTDGPKVRFIEGDIRPHDSSTCFVRYASPDPPLTMMMDSFGALGGAIDGYHNAGHFVGSYIPAIEETSTPLDYARVFTMERTPQGLLTGTVANEVTFDTDRWPLHIGSMSRPTNSPKTQWRIITYGP